MSTANTLKISDTPTPYGACSKCGELLTEEEAPKGVCYNCDFEHAEDGLDGTDYDLTI